MRADISDDDLLQMVRLRAAGVPAVEVGRRFGLSASVVRGATNRVMLADLDHCGLADQQQRGRGRDVVGCYW